VLFEEVNASTAPRTLPFSTSLATTLHAYAWLLVAAWKVQILFGASEPVQLLKVNGTEVLVWEKITVLTKVIAVLPTLATWLARDVVLSRTPVDWV